MAKKNLEDLFLKNKPDEKKADLLGLSTAIAGASQRADMFADTQAKERALALEQLKTRVQELGLREAKLVEAYFKEELPKSRAPHLVTRYVAFPNYDHEPFPLKVSETRAFNQQFRLVLEHYFEGVIKFIMETDSTSTFYGHLKAYVK